MTEVPTRCSSKMMQAVEMERHWDSRMMDSPQEQTGIEDPVEAMVAGAGRNSATDCQEQPKPGHEQ